MSEVELYEALIERSVFHESASDICKVMGEFELSKIEKRISVIYFYMAENVLQFENISKEDI